MKFGERVRTERKRRGWTRDDLAEKIGSSSETIKRMENSDHPPVGSRYRPRVEFLLNISGDDPDGLGAPSVAPLARPQTADTWAAASDAQLLAQLTALVAELTARQATGALGTSVAVGDRAMSDRPSKVDDSGERLVTVRKSDLADPESFTREPGVVGADTNAESRST